MNKATLESRHFSIIGLSVDITPNCRLMVHGYGKSSI